MPVRSASEAFGCSCARETEDDLGRPLTTESSISSLGSERTLELRRNREIDSIRIFVGFMWESQGRERGYK